MSMPLSKSILLVLLWLVCRTASAQYHDIFPLSIGNTFTYDYTSYDTTWWVGNFDYLQVDTGTVTCAVIDSEQIGREAIQWSVRMTVDLERRSKQEIMWFIDTTYSVIDTVDFSLMESMAGLHEITSEGVWLDDTLSVSGLNCIGIWHSPINDTASIFRYDEGTEETIFVHDPYSSAHYDSLFFSEKKGLTRRSYAFYQMTHHHGPVQFKAVLSDFLVSVENRPGLNRLSQQITANPNPFNSSTRISFQINRSAHIYFYIYNIQGQEIQRRDIGYRERGKHTFDLSFDRFPSGMYLIAIQTDSGEHFLGKLTCLK